MLVNAAKSRNGKKLASVLKLDLGSGPNPKEGFEGVDQYPFGGKVKHVLDLRRTPWPWGEGRISELHCSHFLEHLTGVERVGFMNECWRILPAGGQMTLVAPHWSSNRAYGDPTHQWPPVSEMWFYYISRKWRLEQAPHTDVSNWRDGYRCDFEATWGYAMNPAIVSRNQEYQNFALSWYKEAAQDIVATLKALK